MSIMRKRNKNKENLTDFKSTIISEENLFSSTDNIDSMSMVDISIDKLVAAPDEWNFFKKLSPTKEAELLQSISTLGIQNPIIVMEIENENYMILSGHNRTNAYRKLLDYYKKNNDEKFHDYETIPCKIYKQNQLTEKEARTIIIDTNLIARKLTALEISDCIYNKYLTLQNSSQEKSQIMSDIAKSQSLDVRSIYFYRSLINLIAEFKTALQQKKITLKVATRLSLFPVAAQKFILNNYCIDDDFAFIKKNYPYIKKSFALKEFSDEEVIENIKNAFNDLLKVNNVIVTINDVRYNFSKSQKKLKEFNKLIESLNEFIPDLKVEISEESTQN